MLPPTSGEVIYCPGDDNITQPRIGLVFQIVDDILDVTGDVATLGKTPGKDEAEGKQTFATVYGLGRARQIAAEQTQSALEALSRFGERGAALAGMAQYLLSRQN